VPEKKVANFGISGLPGPDGVRVFEQSGGSSACYRAIQPIPAPLSGVYGSIRERIDGTYASGEFMHIHIRAHRWVVWWFFVGVICGIFALTNIFLRDLSRTQDKVILLIGVLHWVLGGFVCYAWEGIEIRKPAAPGGSPRASESFEQEEWHPASDFVLPGNHRSVLLPPRYHGRSAPR
jgi:hypothetical protein